MLGGRQVRIDIREPAQEEPEAQEETEAQPEEQPLRRLTCTRTQAASRFGTQRHSSTPTRSTPALAPAPAQIHKDYTKAPTREI